MELLHDPNNIIDLWKIDEDTMELLKKNTNFILRCDGEVKLRVLQEAFLRLTPDEFTNNCIPVAMLNEYKNACAQIKKTREKPDIKYIKYNKVTNKFMRDVKDYINSHEYDYTISIYNQGVDDGSTIDELYKHIEFTGTIEEATIRAKYELQDYKYMTATIRVYNREEKQFTRSIKTISTIPTFVYDNYFYNFDTTFESTFENYEKVKNAYEQLLNIISIPHLDDFIRCISINNAGNTVIYANNIQENCNYYLVCVGDMCKLPKSEQFNIKNNFQQNLIDKNAIRFNDFAPLEMNGRTRLDNLYI